MRCLFRCSRQAMRAAALRSWMDRCFAEFVSGVSMINQILLTRGGFVQVRSPLFANYWNLAILETRL